MKFFRKNIFWVIAVVLFLAAAGALGWDYYNKWQGEKKIEELANELKRLQQEFYDAKAADKIGGATPRETLDMFISAVEAGDYELASKYFVIERQEEELKSLQNSPKENIKNAMDMLKHTSAGAFLGEDKFFIDEPILVDFIKYPFGNWKIEKI